MTKKDVPAAKLPTEVRNRMGYKKKGGKVNANSMGRGVNLANGGRIVYRVGGDPIGGNPTQGTPSQGQRAYEDQIKKRNEYLEKLEKEMKDKEEM